MLVLLLLFPYMLIMDSYKVLMFQKIVKVTTILMFLIDS